MKLPEAMRPYASGERLRGDDFGPDEIRAWFEQEVEGYAEIVNARPHQYEYVYHAMNRRHAFNRLPPGERIGHALGVGSFTGDEFMPILDRVDRITILEPSDQPVRDRIGHVPATYVKPAMDGGMPFADGTFDLITCFGTLHHIPNVGRVLREMHRVLKPGGLAIVREPAVSMGDWTRPRAGHTRNERGIPRPWMRRVAPEIGFRIEHESGCMFPLLMLVPRKLALRVQKSPAWIALDDLLCRLTSWNLRYWRGGWIDRLAPSSLCFHLRKPGAGE